MKIKSAYQEEIEASEYPEPDLPEIQIEPVDVDLLTKLFIEEMHHEKNRDGH